MKTKTKKPKQKIEPSWQQAVMDVITGKSRRLNDHKMIVAPARLKDFMEFMKWKQREPEEGFAIETNGWDYDWWMTFDKKGEKSYTASGSGYYGGLVFEEAEEEWKGQLWN